ncbi:hypothetical protein BDV93DRAFT_508303 [Ceratobasidium sp. AG-I]|nr:hypothetical protein BDV93DRAFT_508303 [Ceratobasidium sp. AG-I]
MSVRPSSAPSVQTSRDGERGRRSESRESRRRRRSESRSPDEGRNRGRRPIFLSSKKKTTDVYGTAARRITRLIDMNWDPTSVINAGIALLALDSDAAMQAEVASASKKKKSLYDLFFLLSDLIPGFGDTRDWAEVRKTLEDHKSAAKTEDNRTFKTSFPVWQIWDPPLSCDSKRDRGVGHPQCARYLCPIDVDWNDEPSRTRFRDAHDPPMTAENCPAFIYKDCELDPNDLFKGFLRNDLLVRAARTTIFPPSVANVAGNPDHQSGRKSKADIYEMEEVTPGFLAYIAVGVRYALSSETTFNAKGGSFNYQKFYTDIVSNLTDPVCKVESDALMEWWNKRLFPTKHVAEEEAPVGMFARLREQAVQRQVQAEGN